MPKYNGDLSLGSLESYKYPVGSKRYVAPELLQHQLSDFSDLKKCDIWSFGVLVYVSIYNKFPFSNTLGYDYLLDFNMQESRWRYYIKTQQTSLNPILLSIFVEPKQRITIEELDILLEASSRA